MNHVLVIEDSPTLSQLLISRIQAVGDFDCIPAYNFAEAKAVLDAVGNDVFCATVDLSLPDASDDEVVRYLTRRYPGISSVVLTGSLKEGLREDMLRLGVADYVLKNGRHNLEYVATLARRLHRNGAIKALIVDDSPTARSEIRRLLSIQRYQSREVGSLAEAVEALEAEPDIKLVIADCNMDNEMDGIELTERIRARHSKDELAVIGVSSSGVQNLSAMFIKHGANDFLVKPFSPEEFNCRVNQTMEFVDAVAQYKEANRLKNQLLGTAAHDIRGPLGVVQGFAQLLQSADIPGERKATYVRRILDSTNGALNLLDSLLNVAAIETGYVQLEPEAVALQGLVRRRIDNYMHISEKKGIRITEALSDLAPIECDPLRIGQVVDNLLSNAVKYSPHGSSVEVSLEDSGQWQRITVCDEGPGITEEDVPRLFQAYHTLDTATTGDETSTGLGLAICKSMMDAHGGSVGYAPGKSGGSQFYVLLPKSGNARSPF